MVRLNHGANSPARHLAHALLNVVVHALAKAEQLLQLRPVEEDIRGNQHSTEE